MSAASLYHKWYERYRDLAETAGSILGSDISTEVIILGVSMFISLRQRNVLRTGLGAYILSFNFDGRSWATAPRGVGAPSVVSIPHPIGTVVAAPLGRGVECPEWNGAAGETSEECSTESEALEMEDTGILSCPLLSAIDICGLRRLTESVDGGLVEERGVW